MFYAKDVCEEDGHYNEERNHFCETCKIKVCRKCAVTNSHRRHVIKSLQEKAERIREKNLPLLIKERYLKDYNRLLHEIQRAKDRNKRNLKTSKDAIRLRKEYLIACLTIACEEKNNQCDSIFTEVLTKLNETEQRLTKIMNELSNFANLFSETSTSSREIVETEQTFTLKQSIMEEDDFKLDIKDFHLNDKELQGLDFKSLIGDINERSLTLSHKKTEILRKLRRHYKFELSEIVNIIPTSRHSAWINRQGVTMATTDHSPRGIDRIDFDSKGRPASTKTINTGDVSDRDGMMVNQEEDIIFSDYANKCLRKITQKNKVMTKFYSFDSLYPYGLCQSQDGDYLVCLNEHDPYDDVNKYALKSKRCIQKVSKTGNKATDITFTENASNFDLEFPIRVLQNRKTNIVVIDRSSHNDTGRIVVTSKSGDVKTVYKGQKQKHDFDPMSVCYDSKQNWLISDYNNDVIHVLDSEGQFLHYILIDKSFHVHPRSIAVYEDTLWIGDNKGEVQVYKYDL